MELRQLEYFVAVVEEASFTKAAARVHVAQPGVSAQVRKLEDELGQALLDRSGRQVRLTDAGAAVLPYARAALAAAGSARLAVQDLTGLLRGRVAVGMVNASSVTEMPELVAEFHQRYPAVEISLSEASSDQLLEGLRAGRLDLALLGSVAGPPAGIATHVVVDARLVAAVPHGDALRSRASVSLEAICERALIGLPRGSGLRSCVDAACTAAGLQPRFLFEASNLNVVAELARRGLGVAILPESFAVANRRTLHAVAITRPSLRARLQFAWRSTGTPSPAARALVELAHAKFFQRQPSRLSASSGSASHSQ
jgi:DNA-binding transcriptional LysR family regulator